MPGAEFPAVAVMEVVEDDVTVPLTPPMIMILEDELGSNPVPEKTTRNKIKL